MKIWTNPVGNNCLTKPQKLKILRAKQKGARVARRGGKGRDKCCNSPLKERENGGVSGGVWGAPDSVTNHNTNPYKSPNPKTKTCSLKNLAELKKTGMKLSEMQRQFSEYTASLFREGYLDIQFQQLQQLQDESNPEFVMEVVTLFFDDSERLLHDLTSALEQQIVDFKKVDAHVHQFKGSSSSIGAQRVKNACVNFRSFCEEQNADACRACLQQLNQEYFLVKGKLQSLLSMEQQIVAAGGSIPV